MVTHCKPVCCMFLPKEQFFDLWSRKARKKWWVIHRVGIICIARRCLRRPEMTITSQNYYARTASRQTFSFFVTDWLQVTYGQPLECRLRWNLATCCDSERNNHPLPSVALAYVPFLGVWLRLHLLAEISCICPAVCVVASPLSR